MLRIFFLFLMLMSVPNVARCDIHQWLDSIYNEADEAYVKADYNDASKHLEEILPVVEGKEFSDQDRAAVFSLASYVFMRQSIFDRSIEYAERTLAIDRASGSMEDISSSLNTIAAVYYSANQVEKAYRYNQEAVELARQYDCPKHLAIRLGLASEILVKMGRIDEARAKGEEALNIELSLGDANLIGIRQSQLAAVYQAEKDYRSAVPLLEEATANFRTADNLSSLTISLTQLGSIYMEQGLHANAQACLEECLGISLQTGNRLHESKARHLLAELMKDKDPKTAFAYMQQYADLLQNLYSEQNSNALANFEVRYETAQKQHQVEMLEEKVKVRHLWILVLSVLLIAAVVAIALVQHISRLRLKRDQLLVKSNIMGISELGEMPDIHFTNREKEVIGYCAEGLMAKEIADRMGISERTVAVHKNNIFKKLDIQTTVELVIYAKKAGFLPVRGETAEPL